MSEELEKTVVELLKTGMAEATPTIKEYLGMAMATWEAQAAGAMLMLLGCALTAWRIRKKVYEFSNDGMAIAVLGLGTLGVTAFLIEVFSIYNMAVIYWWPRAYLLTHLLGGK